MSGLLMPAHQRAAIQRQKKEAAAAENIQRTSVHALHSDDFVTPKEVQNQLGQLSDYLAERRAVEELYHLPEPCGWRLTILVLTIPEKSDGGVIIVDDAKEQRSLASPQGIVLSMGSAAYKDESRFPDGAWVRLGDRIQFTKYDATMFQIANGQRLGTLNDTQPIAVIDRNWEIPR